MPIQHLTVPQGLLVWLLLLMLVLVLVLVLRVRSRLGMVAVQLLVLRG